MGFMKEQKEHPSAPQVLYAYNVLKWEIEQISAGLELPLGIVREIIASKEGLSEALKDLNTSEGIEDAIRGIIRGAAPEKVKMEALKYLHRETTGRNNIEMEDHKLRKQKLQLDAVNVASNLRRLNLALRKARESSVTPGPAPLTLNNIPEEQAV